ncbi:MAG: hypothetical protein HS108_09785 [Planctomycetes bacterium]|jgi:hypothetical protein|nr:hypothetical protein [Planctomycetota bacterium]MCL4728874.1 hypothetical protein [Planctomycetota bacterium]
MRRTCTLVLVLLAAAVAGCSNPRHYFSLEEWGDGWKLKVEEKDSSFRASWVKGDRRSVKLVNYHDAPNGEFIIVNTLYLEVDAQGKVTNGRLKRFTTPDFSRRARYEGGAKWWRVLRGSCVLDAQGNGEVDVACEGKYEFAGKVVPDKETKVIKPE